MRLSAASQVDLDRECYHVSEFIRHGDDDTHFACFFFTSFSSCFLFLLYYIMAMMTP